MTIYSDLGCEKCGTTYITRGHKLCLKCRSDDLFPCKHWENREEGYNCTVPFCGSKDKRIVKGKELLCKGCDDFDRR